MIHPQIRIYNINDYYYTDRDLGQDAWVIDLHLPDTRRGFAEWVLKMIDEYDLTPIELAATMHSIQLEKGHPDE